jgi:signal transduction histidine kinase
MGRLGRIWLAALLLVLGAAADHAGAQPRRVLLIHSFGPHFAPWAPVAGRFREELFKQSPNPIDLYEGSLQSDRFAPTQDQGPFIDYLRNLFSGRDLDLVVALGAPAARFFLANRAQIFPSAPLLVMGADIRTFSEFKLSGNETSVPIGFDQAVQIENILQVLPDTRTIAVVLGDSPLERFWVEELRKSYQRFTSRVTFDWYNKLSLDQMVERVRQLPPQSAIYYATVRVDAHGVPQEEDRVMERLRENARAPIFSYIDSNFGHGIVGGPLFSTEEIARQSAAAAVRILGGEKPADISTPLIGLSAPTYDWRELQRWGISESRLPPGSVVRFREPSPWEQYRWQLLGVLSVMLLQAALIAWLLVERQRRQKAESEARRRLVEVIHLNRSAEVGALSSSFAHELGQPLASISLNTDAAAMLLRADPPPLGQLKEIVQDIGQSNRHAAEIMQSMRTLLKRTKQADVQDVDLSQVISDAIHILTPEARKRNVVLNASSIRDALLVRADRIYLQQVILNLAANGMDAMAAAATERAQVTIETALADTAHVEVSIIDTGPGVPADKLREVFTAFYTTKEHGTGLGLSISRTIVESFGGKIWAENRSGGGAVFRFTLPLSAQAA